jgi:hypothetical protein
MPQVSAVLSLPEDVRQWLDEELMTLRFSSYHWLSSELKAKGYTISKSALHRYCKTLRAKQPRTAADSGQIVSALCILAAAISSPDNVVVTAKAYMNLVSDNEANGG